MISILADGTITTCGMGRYAESFCYGKLGEVSVREVCNGHPLIRYMRNSIPARLKGVCGKCVMRSKCLGYCRLNHEDVRPDSLCDPFWMCEEMYQRGKFPETRLVEREALSNSAAH